MRKLFTILTLAIMALIAIPGGASASVVPVGQGQVEPGTVTDGGQVVFSGCGFEPGETITIAEDGNVEGTVTADEEGCFSTTVTVNGVGDSVLTATGAARVVTATVQVLAASGGAPGTGGDAGGLPVTGSEGTATQVWAGIGLLGLGAGMIALTVSRRRVATATIA